MKALIRMRASVVMRATVDNKVNLRVAVRTRNGTGVWVRLRFEVFNVGITARRTVESQLKFSQLT